MAERAIEVSGLTKRFGSVVAVEDLSFTVDYGRIVGFLGQNGAGKTTTMRTLLGLVQATDGRTAVAGRTYADLDDPIRTVGAVLDGGMLHPGRSGRNHVRTIARAAGIGEDRVEEVLAMVGLEEAAKRRAGGYSLGMRQRLGLATAFLGDPRILVLDEPANGLDPQGIRWIRDFLRYRAQEGRAILISSHVLSELAQIVDEVVVINRGRFVTQAPIGTLLSRGRRGVRVAGPDVARLRELLLDEGADVETVDGAIVVGDRSGEQIGRLVAEHRIVLSELSPVDASLEDVFLELTETETRPT
jgi:ABC-2 type transport system ATP-binding protein